MRAPLFLPILLATALSAPAETQLVIESTAAVDVSSIRRVIGPRLEYVVNQPASRARAADAAFLIEQVLQNRGFNDAGVTWKILDSRTIRLRITPGPRQVLGTVTITGVEDAKLRDQLARLFGLPAEKRNNGLGDRPPLATGDTEQGLDYLRQKLNSLGHWDPEIGPVERSAEPGSNRVNFTIPVAPGPLHTIARPTFTGEGTARLVPVAEPFIGRVADTTNINALRLAVTEFYRSRGFIDAEVSMTLETENRRVIPQFTITEGDRVRLREVTFEGLEKTNPYRLDSRLRGLEGEYLNANVVDHRIRQIIATGAFSSVVSDTTPVAEGAVDLTLRLEEAKARGVSFSAGFDTYEGPILGTTYYDRNLLGNLWNFTSGLELTARAIRGEVTLTDPWLWGTDLTGGARLFALSNNHEGYSIWRSGLEGILTYPVTRNYQLDLRLGWAIINTQEDGLPVSALGETVYQNPYLRFVQRLDHRDSAVLPTSGWHLENPIEIGAALGQISTTYFKTELEGSYHLPLGDAGKIGAGLRGGVLIPGGGRANLPIDLRYFIGGARSVRSVPDRELGPSAQGNPTGGQAYWVANLEYVRPLAGALRGVAFIDAGGLSQNWEDVGANETEVAIGLGLRLNLPVGPVRLEYGHSLTQDGNEPSGAWHFAIGIAF